MKHIPSARSVKSNGAIYPDIKWMNEDPKTKQMMRIVTYK